ncbi:MAG TPA: hypothetical protein VFE60_22720 [Roseiarcus sp.]|nr:hypothetical protein [Roseiarcus sp.]
MGNATDCGYRRGRLSRDVTLSDDVVRVDHERRLRRLLRRLPGRMQAASHWLRKPASRWARIPAGMLLIIGGCLSILPIFGLWMLPLGLMLLADDIPPLRRFRDRALDWLERRRPHGSPRRAARRGPRRPVADTGRA